MKKKKKKVKIVYTTEDTGQTIYSMAALDGKTPEEQEELDKKRKNKIEITSKERFAMIKAAFVVYGPVLLCLIVGFSLVALIMYLFIK